MSKKQIKKTISKKSAPTATADSELIEPVTQKPPMTFLQLFIKATLLALLFAFVMILITAALVAGYLFKQAQTFSKASQTPLSELKDIAQAGWNATPTATDGKKNILLLGTDSLANRQGDPELTDTIMLISADLNSGAIRTLPLPRDLWSSEYKTKINALYEYGKERYPEQPEKFPTEVITQMTGVPIHHTVVLSIETVSQLIDAVGGLEVEVVNGFTDTQFPRSDVDIRTERDPAKLYETITFPAGKQVMSGETALKYMRSRHSEGDTGTDIDRGKRQQQVLDALMKKLLNAKTLTDPKQAGQLFLLYKTTFGDVLPVTDLIATGKQLYPYRNVISQTSATISIYPEEQTGSITNPPIKKYNQWVYEVRDPEVFKKEVQTDLGI